MSAEPANCEASSLPVNIEYVTVFFIGERVRRICSEAQHSVDRVRRPRGLLTAHGAVSA